jgi:membrane protein
MYCWSSVLGLGIALWSANAGMKAIFDALNIIYDEEEKRGFIWLNVVSLFFTICAIAAAGLAVALVVVFPLITAVFGLTSLDAPIVVYLRWPLMVVLIILGLALLFRYGPSRRLPKWRWISVGSVFAALAWLAGSSLFSWYLGNFDNYNATYPDRAGFDRRARQAARHPRCRHGGHGGGGKGVRR